MSTSCLDPSHRTSAMAALFLLCACDSGGVPEARSGGGGTRAAFAAMTPAPVATATGPATSSGTTTATAPTAQAAGQPAAGMMTTSIADTMPNEPAAAQPRGPVEWTMFGYDLANTRDNRTETKLSVTTVSKLVSVPPHVVPISTHSASTGTQRRRAPARAAPARAARPTRVGPRSAG